MSKKYTIKDFKEAILGAFVTTIFFFSLRAGEPYSFINPTTGIIVTVAWFTVLFFAFEKVPDGEHFFLNIILVFIFCGLLSIGFGLTTYEQILKNPFGSPAMIATWMALPVALMFDKYNVSSVLTRYYVRGVNKK